MAPSTRRNLALLILPLFVGLVLTQRALDPQLREINKGQKTMMTGLSNEFILGPLLGLQQAVAGLLWVRADEFFHEGDYDAILPIVRMVTWLDPHNLDVYITGAWHLAYNFTDSSERSDRRYLPASQRLLEEGDANNPEVYDIAFELGWQNTDKLKNYPRAHHWYLECSKRNSAGTDGRATEPVPMFVYHQLAHSLTRLGRIDESVAVWKKALAMSEQRVVKSPKDFTARNVRDSERHNLTLTLKRRYSRDRHEINWDIDKAQTQSTDLETGEPSPRDCYLFLNQAEIARRAGQYRAAGLPVPAMAVGQPRPPATQPQWETAFDVKPVFSDDKVLELKGRFNIGDGARVTIRLHDDQWTDKVLKEFTFNVNQDITVMQDQHSVRVGTWGRKIDMSKDPRMYGFKADTYYLVLEFDPRGTSPFIQDRFGWSGEGMTDRKYVWTDASLDPPVRRIRKVFKISRDHVFRRKAITDANVIKNDEYLSIMRAK